MDNTKNWNEKDNVGKIILIFNFLNNLSVGNYVPKHCHNAQIHYRILKQNKYNQLLIISYHIWYVGT